MWDDARIGMTHLCTRERIAVVTDVVHKWLDTAPRLTRGPTGRRAALAGGPDVWEICLAARRVSGGKQVAERLAEELSLTPDRVAVALRYPAEFPEEIEARIELHERKTAHSEPLV